MKRTLDVVLACAAMLVMLPVLLAVALLVRRKMGAPVFFRQARPGRYGQPFEILKFRTMRDDRDHEGRQLPDDERLTGFGKWLRATSLDELPELWNVVRGDMSLVGPRPLRMDYLSLYSEEQARRHEVRPGITGWAQINGRNQAPWPERLQMDVWYVDHHNFWLDLRILWQTAWKVVRRDGISAEGHVTMPPFRGER